jgi:hypothetical protein
VGTNRVELTLFPEYSTLVSAERNLEEYPLFELKARQRGSKARLFERVIEGEGGISLKQTWKVIPSGEYGMPGPVDQDVYLAVLQLLEQRGGMPEDGELAFSLYELRKVLGWSDDSGGAYREIRDALVRIQLTGVQSSNAFYSAADEQLIADSFNVWSVHFAQRRKKKKGGAGSRDRTTQDRHVLRFHPVFIRNYEAQYLKGLDADFFWSLRMPLRKRLYRLIDLQREGGLSWSTDLFAVRDQVPLDYPYPSQIKRALRKAHGELEEKGFLSGVEYEGNAGVLYRISQAFARRQKALELSGTPQERFALERLMREGVRGTSSSPTGPRGACATPRPSTPKRASATAPASSSAPYAKATPSPNPRSRPRSPWSTHWSRTLRRSGRRSRTARHPPLPHRRTRSPRSSGATY